jgi:hypothetical protein
MMTVKLHPLPAPYRKDIAAAELEVHRAYGDSINHESRDYDVIHERAYGIYSALCERASVCVAFRCFEDAEHTQYCDAHANREVRGCE